MKTFLFTFKWVGISWLAWLVRAKYKKQQIGRPTETDHEKMLPVLKEIIRQGERKLEIQAQARKTVEDRISATATWMLTLATATIGANVWLDSIYEKPLVGSLKEIQPALDVGAAGAGTALILILLSWLGASMMPWLPWHDAGGDLTSEASKDVKSEIDALVWLSKRHAKGIAVNKRMLRVLTFLYFWPLFTLFISLIFIMFIMLPAGLKDVEEFEKHFQGTFGFILKLF